MVPPPKPSNLKFVRATFAYVAKDSDELSFEEGDLLYILDWTTDPAWWKARCRGKEGLVPSNYLTSPNATELNPLHDACRRGNLDLLTECLANKVPVNAQDKAGNTALHWAARSGHADCMARLLETCGGQCNIKAKNRLGDTALHLAARKGSVECVRLLRHTREADLSVENGDGQKPLDLATEPETKSELKRWLASIKSDKNQSFGEYGQDEYGRSDEEDSSTGEP